MSEFPTVPPWGLNMGLSLLNGLNTPVKEAGDIMAEAEAPCRPAQPTVPQKTLKMTRRGDARRIVKSARWVRWASDVDGPSTRSFTGFQRLTEA